MLRTRLNNKLVEAMRAKDVRTVSTVRLIIAALKDRDIAARSRGILDGIEDPEILQMLQVMVKQRQDAIALYEQGGRLELAEKEREEIAIIQGFMPRQLSDEEIREAVAEAIRDTGAAGLKDMGKVMAELRGRYLGGMDFTKASRMVREAFS